MSHILNNFGGMNAADSLDIVAKKWQSPYIMNCFSDPEGAISKLFGRSKHNAAAIGSDDEVTGIFELDLDTAQHFYCIAENKFYKDNSGTWEDRTGGVSITDSQDNLWCFSKFQDNLIGTSLQRDAAIEHDGGAGNAAAVSNMPAGKHNFALKNRLFSLNTAAQPKLAYWSGINDRTSWDTVNDFLNFKGAESDDMPITGGIVHGSDSAIISKIRSMFRCYHTGTTPPFKYYPIETGGIGCISHHSMQVLPAVGTFPARLIWLYRDNFYTMIGDTVSSVGDDIKPYFSSGQADFTINHNRTQFAVSGIIKEKNLYFCALTKGAGTTHDVVFILNYKTMQWFMASFRCNSFGIRKISNREFLYSGSYNGFTGKHDPDIYNDLGSSYGSIWHSPWINFGDANLDKKISYIYGLLKAVGAFDVDVSVRTDLDVTWTSLGTFSGAAGGMLLGVSWDLGTTALGAGVMSSESYLEALKQCKRIQFKLEQNTVDWYFTIYALAFMWQPTTLYKVGSFA